MSNKRLLFEIMDVVQEDGQNLLGRQSEVKEIEKEGRDFLTNADLDSDSFIKNKLQEITPEIPVYSEEGEETIDSTDEEKYIIDPLDGTVNFFNQDSFWGISVALVKNKRTQLGVVYLPDQDQLIGVTQEGKIEIKGKVNLRVGMNTDISKPGSVWTDWTKNPESLLSVFPEIAEHSPYPQIRLCCTASLIAVATGKISAYIHPQPGPEDIAAGCLIVEKAGGRVTDFEGNSWTPFSKSIVASNGLVHDQLLEIFK